MHAPIRAALCLPPFAYFITARTIKNAQDDDDDSGCDVLFYKDRAQTAARFEH